MVIRLFGYKLTLEKYSVITLKARRNMKVIANGCRIAEVKYKDDMTTASLTDPDGYILPGQTSLTVHYPLDGCATATVTFNIGPFEHWPKKWISRTNQANRALCRMCLGRNSKCAVCGGSGFELSKPWPEGNQPPPYTVTPEPDGEHWAKKGWHVDEIKAGLSYNGPSIKEVYNDALKEKNMIHDLPDATTAKDQITERVKELTDEGMHTEREDKPLIVMSDPQPPTQHRGA